MQIKNVQCNQATPEKQSPQINITDYLSLQTTNNQRQVIVIFYFYQSTFMDKSFPDVVDLCQLIHNVDFTAQPIKSVCFCS